MTAVTAPGWAEVREIYELGTEDEYRRYASATVEVHGTLTPERLAVTPARVRLEHTFHPQDTEEEGPWYQPHVVLGVDTDSQGEVMLPADVARRLAAELIAAADRLEGGAR